MKGESSHEMINRDPGNDGNLLRSQCDRLRAAVDGYYADRKEQALNIAITIRVLVHQTGKSHSLLSRLNPDYWECPYTTRSRGTHWQFSMCARRLFSEWVHLGLSVQNLR